MYSCCTIKLQNRVFYNYFAAHFFECAIIHFKCSNGNIQKIFLFGLHSDKASKPLTYKKVEWVTTDESILERYLPNKFCTVKKRGE